MKAVFKLHFDCGRMGQLDGVFVAEKEQMDKLVKSGIQVYFGEVLGKHSEIYDPISEKDYTLVSEDPNVVSVIEDNKLSTGYNPFNYTTVGAKELLGDKYEDDLTVSEVLARLD